MKDKDQTDSTNEETLEGNSPPTEPVEEISELDKLKSDNEKLRNEYLYLRAEFDNFRKNSIKERSDLIKYGSERMAGSLLNVLDIFEKALSEKIDTNNIDSFVDGIQMTSTELKNTLQNFGVTAIDSVGEAFDPKIHEALGSEPSDKIPEGHIAQVFKKPYKIHDKVLRPGQVIVATAVSVNEKESVSDDKDEIIGFE